MMRTLSIAIVLLLAACSSGPPPFDQEGADRRANIASIISQRTAAEAARAAEATAAEEANRLAHNERVAARAEARTSYLAQHPDVSDAVREALLAGDRIVIGMTIEEALLVIETARFLGRTVTPEAVIEQWEVDAAPVTALTFSNDALVSWVATASAAGASQQVVQGGERVAVSTSR